MYSCYNTVINTIHVIRINDLTSHTDNTEEHKQTEGKQMKPNTHPLASSSSWQLIGFFIEYTLAQLVLRLFSS